MARISEKFEEIYSLDEWTHGSGPGSIRKFNVPFLEYITQILREHNVRTIVDVGCGDFQMFTQFDFRPARYLGLDVAGSVVERNQRKFGNFDVRFAIMPTNLSDLPEADLYIIKDVLIHLDNKTSVEIALSAVSKSNYVVFVNNVSNDAMDYNREIGIGDFRPVDVSLAPFDLEVIQHFVYGESWAYDPHLPKILAFLLRRRVWPGRKLVQLVRGKRPL